MAKLKTGIKAPAFVLPDQTGEMRSLKDFDASHVVLFFYSKDLTPGCTIEAEGFSKKIAAFKKLDAVVLGISGGTTTSKLKFCKKHNLKQTMLSDEDFAVAKKYGAFGEKKFMGKTYDGIIRTTVVVNKAGKVVHIFQDVKPEGHAEEVLKFLGNIGKEYEKGRSAKTLESPARNKRLTKNLRQMQAREAKARR